LEGWGFFVLVLRRIGAHRQFDTDLPENRCVSLPILFFTS
jgi:hypothetical protein